jgi:membrane associated rhomboid family serine protease
MIDSDPRERRSGGEPAFNLPPVVLGTLLTLLAVQAATEWLLDNRQVYWLVTTFGFTPYLAGTRIWSFLTYALLHGSWSHLLVNAVWLAAFGSPLAWRFGAVRFLAFSAAGAVAGAGLHLAIYPHAEVPMVGASAAISAHMAGASRFVFSRGAPLWGRRGPAAYLHPAPPLLEVMRNRQVLAFLGAWFAVNLIFGLAGAGSGLVDGAIAWDAHVGGFAAGLLLFPLFDPVGRTS